MPCAAQQVRRKAVSGRLVSMKAMCRIANSFFPVQLRRALDSNVAVQRRYHDSQRKLWISASIYVVGGAVMLLIDVYAASIAYPEMPGFSFSGWLATVGWLLPLTIGLVVAATWRDTVMIAATYGTLIALQIGYLHLLCEQCTAIVLFGDWWMEMVGTMGLLLCFVHRRIRAVGPLVLPLTLFAFAGALSAFFLIGHVAGTMDVDSEHPSIMWYLLALGIGVLGANGFALATHLLGIHGDGVACVALIALAWANVRKEALEFRNAHV